MWIPIIHIQMRSVLIAVLAIELWALRRNINKGSHHASISRTINCSKDVYENGLMLLDFVPQGKKPSSYQDTIRCACYRFKLQQRMPSCCNWKHMH